MYSINGQYHADYNGNPNVWPDYNFFENSFTNHHVGPAKNLKVAALVKKFTSATPWVQSVGISDCAKYDEAGKTDEG